MKSTYTTILFLLLALSLNAADAIKVYGDISWVNGTRSIELSDGSFVEAYTFKGAVHSLEHPYLPVFTRTIPLEVDGNVKVKLVDAIYAPVSALVVAEQPAEEPLLKHTVVYNRKKPELKVQVQPLRIDPLTGTWQQLVEYSLLIEVEASSASKSSSANSVYANGSVLANGNWYKVSVQNTGIHKVDYALLKELGVDVDNIDPKKIQVYGNGGGILPEANSSYRHDDLVQNPIVVSGENDGSFNAGDYILFYAEGPNKWEYDDLGQRFSYQVNYYDDHNYYFITVGDNNGLRISSEASLNGATTTVTAFDEHLVHEKEEVNLLKSGRSWFGDHFNFAVTNRSFNFNVPNIITSEPIDLGVSAAARSTLANSSMPVSVNGQNVATLTLADVPSGYTRTYASIVTVFSDVNVNSSNIAVDVAFSNPSSGAEAWLDRILINARRGLVFTGSQLSFRDMRSVAAGAVTRFSMQGGNSATRIWDVTNPTGPFAVQHSTNGSNIEFVVATDTLKEFVAFNDNSSFYAPEAVGRVENQNLHALGQPDMIIVANPPFISEAERLADFHRSVTNISVEVVSLPEIYNEFSSGRQDVTAIRDMMKMLYDRAGTNEEQLPEYLLLFGDGSYDPKNILGSNSNHIPTYETYESVEPIYSFCTDDYFGFLDDSEGGYILADMKMDLSIGRLPFNTLQEAGQVVDKIIHYKSNVTLGSWRNEYAIIADDEDTDTHIIDAENHASLLEGLAPVYNVDKIYMDAYQQRSTPAGNRYPDVKDAINRKIYTGTLVLNYVGHGGVNGWAHERIIDNTDVRSWENYDELPLFITATCEFTRFDDPEKVSSGEEVLLNPVGGGIALVTTLRLVTAGENEKTNQALLNSLYGPRVNGRMPTMGEATKIAKNDDSLQPLNARKFVLVGDPALTLNYPEYNVVSTTVNGQAIGSANVDTLKALAQVTITGEVRDHNDNLMSEFNGEVNVAIFDKAQEIVTLGNDASSSKYPFQLQKNTIFRGKASVTNGEFSYTFIVPKDISYNFGQGKISYYAQNGTIDAHGYTSDIVIGGTSSDFPEDNDGPELEVFMNDENFISGGLTDSDPILLVKLFDFNGINTAGSGVGHEITAVLDGDTKNTYVLNDYYETLTDDYRNGIVKYPLSNIAPGYHEIEVKAWDTYNNSATGSVAFVVASSPCLVMEDLINYPNPFANSTKFQFEHNKPGESLFVQVKIFSATGALVKTIEQEVVSEGYIVRDLEWDGLSDEGANLAKGVYVYRLQVSTADCGAVHEFEKLVILK